MVNTLPAKLETRVRSLGREDPLEKEMATHSRILTWKIAWAEEPGGLWFMDDVAKSQTRLSDYNSFLCSGILIQEFRDSESLICAPGKVIKTERSVQVKFSLKASF